MLEDIEDEMTRTRAAVAKVEPKWISNQWIFYKDVAYHSGRNQRTMNNSCLDLILVEGNDLQQNGQEFQVYNVYYERLRALPG
jgi:hypothetical protein